MNLVKAVERPIKQRRNKERPAPRPDQFTYDFKQAQQMGGPGKTTFYNKFPELLVRVGGRTFVRGDGLRQLLTNGTPQT